MASVPSPDQTVPCSRVPYSMQLSSLGRGVLGSSQTQRGVLKLTVPLEGIQGPLTSARCLNSQTRLLSGCTERHRGGSPCTFTETLVKPLAGLHTLLVALSSLPNRRNQPSFHTLTFQWGMETEKPPIYLSRTKIYFTDLKGP